MTQSIAILAALLLYAMPPAPALAGDPGEPSGETTRTKSAAIVDLKCFHEQAVRSLRSFYGDAELLEEMITFQDGVGSTDLPPLFDHARIVYSARVAGSSFRDPGVRVGYYASLQGFDKLTLVRAPEATEAAYFSANTLIAIFLEHTSRRDMETIRGVLTNKFPDYRQTYLEMIHALIFEGGNPAQLPNLETALSESGAFF